MNNDKAKEILLALNRGIAGAKFYMIDPTTMNSTEIAIAFQELERNETEFRKKLEAIFKEIHNDNIGAPIERYYEDAENYFANKPYVLNKLKQRIKTYFEEEIQ